MAEFPSEKAKVSCRVCGKVMLSKNYTKHLTDFHKSENASNKRGKDQMSLVDFFSSNDGPSPSRRNKTTSEHNVRVYYLLGNNTKIPHFKMGGVFKLYKFYI